MRLFHTEKQSQFADMIGVSRAYVNDLLRGKKKFDQPFLSSLANHGVDLNWFLSGNGQPMHGAEAPGLVKITHFNVQVGAGSGEIVPSEEKEQEPWFFSEKYYKRMIRHNPNQVVMVDVVGDSMMPTLAPGDVVAVLMDGEKQTVDGLWVVRLGNTVVVKRVQYMVGGKLRLVSDNPAYETQLLDLNEEQPDFALIGRVVWAPRHF